MDGERKRERNPLRSGGRVAQRAVVYMNIISWIHMFSLFRANLLQCVLCSPEGPAGFWAPASQPPMP